MMASPTRLPSMRKPRPVSMIENPLSNLPDLSNVSSEADSQKKLNRRSLLAQFSRKPSALAKDQVIIKENDEHESEGSRHSEEARPSSESNRRRALDEQRQAILPPSKLSRPVSMIPPRGSSNKTHKSRSKVPDLAKEIEAEPDADHAIAQSLAALTGEAPSQISQPSMPALGLKRSGSTKLPQASRIGVPSIPSRTTSAKSKDSPKRKHKIASGIQTAAVFTVTEEQLSPSIERPTLSKSRTDSLSSPTTDPTLNDATATLPKTTSTIQHARTTSQASQPSSPPRTRASNQAPQTTSPPRTAVLTRSRPTSQIIPPSSKPSFTTYQQHYSPAKSSLPKPPVPLPRASSKRVATADEDTSANFETTKQQIELLQLSILHQSSTKCLNEYTASAKRKLSKTHSKLRKDYETLRATELVHQRATNLSSLDTWCPDIGLLVENLQILSLVYSDLTSLMEEGSRHSDVVSMFELWMNEAEVAEPGTFVQPLSEDWKAAHASLALKLRSIQRNLRVLPPVKSSDDGSGLEVVFKACKTLVEDMLKELEVMAKLEAEMMARENVRVEDEVKSMLMNDDVMSEAWTPAWKKVS